MKRKQNQIAEGSSRRKLTQYHRWINERREQKSVETLRKWVIQEVEFGTVAAEMIHGLKHKGNKYHRKKSRTFWSEDKKRASSSNVLHVGKDIRYGVVKNSRVWIFIKDWKKQNINYAINVSVSVILVKHVPEYKYMV